MKNFKSPPHGLYLVEYDTVKVQSGNRKYYSKHTRALMFLRENDFNGNCFFRVNNYQYFINELSEVVFFKDKEQEVFYKTDMKSISYEGLKLCQEVSLLKNLPE